MAGDKRGHVALCSQGPASAVRSLQLIFSLVPSCNYRLRSQGKKKMVEGEEKRNLGQVVHALPWGPIPTGQITASSSPLFPQHNLLPSSLCSWGMSLCSELTNSSPWLSSHQPQLPNCLHEQGD